MLNEHMRQIIYQEKNEILASTSQDFFCNGKTEHCNSLFKTLKHVNLDYYYDKKHWRNYVGARVVMPQKTLAELCGGGGGHAPHPKKKVPPQKNNWNYFSLQKIILHLISMGKRVSSENAHFRGPNRSNDFGHIPNRI